MKTLLILTKRNSKLFFKDKGMFFSSLITPAILLVLYVTFLSNVYRDSFLSALPEGFALSDSIIDGVVGGQLASSLLAVCCVTIAFCSNLLMIQDKVTGSVRDLTVTPVRRSVLAMGYFASSALVTLIVCLVTCGICFAYLAAIGGWFLSGGDIALILLDVFLLTLFGTALSSCLHYFLTTQGQLSAVGTLVSAGYGFVCGAYMPMSNFPVALQKALSFLPGTYGTSLLHNWMRGALDEMGSSGVPSQVIDAIRDGIDCNIYFSGKAVSEPAMFLIVAGSVLVVTAIYILINALCRPRYGDR